jgi:hypothetical protein
VRRHNFILRVRVRIRQNWLQVRDFIEVLQSRLVAADELVMAVRASHPET